MGMAELNPIEKALDLGVAAMARAWAVEEAFMEFVIQTKHPGGLPLEKWRQEMETLREGLHARASELLPEVRRACFDQAVQHEQGPK